jgi:hypothetical protein
MRILLIVSIAITVGGVVLLASMFHRDDSRLGMAGLGALMVAEAMAMVYAVADQ